MLTTWVADGAGVLQGRLHRPRGQVPAAARCGSHDFQAFQAGGSRDGAAGCRRQGQHRGRRRSILNMESSQDWLFLKLSAGGRGDSVRVRRSLA